MIHILLSCIETVQKLACTMDSMHSLHKAEIWFREKRRYKPPILEIKIYSLYMRYITYLYRTLFWPECVQESCIMFATHIILFQYYLCTSSLYK